MQEFVDLFLNLLFKRQSFGNRTEKIASIFHLTIVYKNAVIWNGPVPILSS